MQYRAIVDGIPGGSTDYILTLKDPAGNVLQSIDTGTSPETVTQVFTTTGTYTYEISGFQGDLGDFTFKVQEVISAAVVAHRQGLGPRGRQPGPWPSSATRARPTSRSASRSPAS